jgi:hypothetical protein
MSTLKTNNVQVGQSVTATNNFTLYQPSSPDGTVRLGVGNAGATTADVITANSSGNVGIGTSSPAYRLQIAAAPATSANFVAQFAARTSGADANVGDYSQFGGSGDSGYFGRRYNATIGWMAAIGGTNAVAFHTGNIGSETERARIDSTGNFSITQTPGKYTVDVTGGATSIANGGTVDFSNASGMLVVNNHSNGGVTIYLCGGGSVTTTSSVIGTVGSFAYVGGINGYRWTNNFGSTATFGFFFVRTRPNA